MNYPEKIRHHLVLAALRFVSLRCRMIQLEVDEVGILFKNGQMSLEDAERKLEELEILDLAYPYIQMDCEAVS
jgi:hypothetical protein